MFPIVLLALLSVLVVSEAKTNPKFLESCGGWRPCLEMHSKEDGGAPRVWFESWNSTIQPKLDRLLEVSSEREPKSGHPDGLLVLMSGDSTMIQQFQVLSEFIFLRHDFYPVVGKDAERLQKYEVTYGTQRRAHGSVTFVFYRVFEACMLRAANRHVQQAHTIYFGCGMHLLHLYPTYMPSLLDTALRSWTHYEQLLTQQATRFREVNNDVKLVYMTTHSIDESRYFGEWEDTLNGFLQHDPEYLEACKNRFGKLLPQQSPWTNRLEDLCVDTVFGERSVRLLNDRGIKAMKSLDVAILPAHTLVEGETFATPEADGRHYPILVPLEVFWFLTIVVGDT